MRLTATSGGRRFRRPPSQKTFWFGLLSLLLSLAVVATVAGMRTKEPEPGNRLLTELATLVGDNHLFIRPGLSADGGPSWSASAYGLSALAAADGHPKETGEPSALAQDLRRHIDDEPVWARWYAVQVEQSTGISIPGSWAKGILDDYAASDDPATRIALVAATVDVVHAKSMRIPPDVRRELAADLESAVPAARSPYSRCRAQQAARYLQLDATKWMAGSPDPITLDQAFSAESVMDVYGALCQGELTGRQHGGDVKSRVLQWLEPHLTMEVAGSEFEAYYLVESWVKAGGDRADLAPVTESLRARVDPGTGLLKEHVVRLGTLEQTYAVAVLAERVGTFRQISDSRTIAAVRDQVLQARAHRSPTGLLMCAVVLRYAGAADTALESEAVALALSRLGGTVNREKVVLAHQIISQLRELGRDVPPLTAELFTVRGAEERYLAWTLLGMSDHLKNGPAVRQALASEATELEKAFAEPEGLMAKEVAAGLSAADNTVGRGSLLRALGDWPSSVRGCAGFRELYRPLKAEKRCTLDATVDLVTSVDTKRFR
jgi:hypothetical protein